MFQNLLVGGCAGASTLLIFYPLDLIRTKYISNYPRKYNGLTHCFTSLLKSEGPRGLYKGFRISLVVVTSYRACYFGFYDTAKMFIGTNIFTKFLVALATTAASGLIATPFDTVRTILLRSTKNSKESPCYTGIIDCFIKSQKALGLHGFFRGFPHGSFRFIGPSLVVVLYDQLQTAFEALADESIKQELEASIYQVLMGRRVHRAVLTNETSCYSEFSIHPIFSTNK